DSRPAVSGCKALNSRHHHAGTVLAWVRPRGTRMSTLVQDLRYAARLMRKTPLLTVIVLATVALCVGANTAVFAVVQAALLRPLPYPDADRIVIASDLAPGEIVDWRARSKSFAAMAALRDGFFDLTGPDRPQRLIGAITNASFFDVTGV